jgi:hypothetical protein
VSGVSAPRSRERAKLRGYLERLLGLDDAPAVEHGHRRTERSVRERDGPDSLAQTRHILRSARALRQGLRRQRKAM